MEDDLVKEMKRLAVPHHSNLVNIVALQSVTQEREELVRVGWTIPGQDTWTFECV